MLPTSIEKHTALRIRLMPVTGQTLFQWDKENNLVTLANTYCILSWLTGLTAGYTFCLSHALHIYFTFHPLEDIQDEVEQEPEKQQFATLVLEWGEVIVSFVICILMSMQWLKRDEIIYLMNQILLYDKQLMADLRAKGLELDAEQKRAILYGGACLYITMITTVTFPFLLNFALLHPLEPTHVMAWELLEIDLSPSKFGIVHVICLFGALSGLVAGSNAVYIFGNLATCYWPIATGIYHLIQMMLANNSRKTVEPEEVVVTCCSIAMLTQTLITMYTMEHNPDEFGYTVTQIFGIGDVKYRGWPNSKRLPDLPEIFGYGMFVGFCNFTFACILYPLVRDYDPINMVLKDILPEIPRRILATVYYGPMCFFATNYCAQFMLMILTSCQMFEKQTEWNMKASKGIPIENEMNWLERLLQVEMKLVFKTLDKFSRGKKVNVEERNIENERPMVAEIAKGGFEGHRKLHNCIYIQLAQSNRGVHIFVPGMIGVGIAFCVACNYICLTMYDNEEFVLFVGCAFVVIICIYVLIIFFCAHASLPLVYTEDTILYWKGKVYKKLQRKQCKSMIPFGFMVGSFFMGKKTTALDIMDTICNYTIDLLLA
ncbi:unnamed protein product [Orchesella dallaii]|uniref:Odorant receptor n=1 Tax=Orchesella dallaii TaxID=48710 RepID=A0ABP1QCU2_9HEXA